MTYKLPEPVAYIHDGGEGRLWWCESVDADGKNKKDDVELFTAGQMQAAYEAGQKSQVRISIPTDAMEQEFQNYHRRGYEAGQRNMLERAIARFEAEGDPFYAKPYINILKELLK